MQSRRQGNAQGIDVSHHQGVIDWPKVASAGISFVLIKATQNSMDPMFLSNVKGAKAAGLLVGAYHYMDDSVTTADKAKVAAQMFYNAIQAAGGSALFDLPFVLDYESNKNGLSKAVLSANAKAYLEEINRLTGAIPMLYTYPSFIGNFSGLSDYPLWISRYSNQAPADASGWNSWNFWQYSDGKSGGVLPNGSRMIPGIAGGVDLNEFDGTIDQLRQRYGKKQTRKDDVKMSETNSDINQVSPWAADAWKEATDHKYFDGSRPGAPMTREEAAIVVNRLRKNLLALIQSIAEDVSDLEQRMQDIERK
ncbi:glycoside hydrolase family 25 protein [Paenibacillus sp. KQZ6P-2]|uniref:Glycoside hydrolase family 25 protein n=1 Tax=Paenibacillus mangrovi TaxID=2931978 RepID=A0A9X1WPA0_9BACL|nr:glycoside hydrolase family 25 protein [Paenibacillus mangrovi]MCJ8012563.1 glycoside hydrolase family 25 protein [Paenibacillus mangrovi]